MLDICLKDIDILLYQQSIDISKNIFYEFLGAC